jgi:hypothetical protein
MAARLVDGRSSEGVDFENKNFFRKARDIVGASFSSSICLYSSCYIAN